MSAPIGLKINVEQKVKAAINEVVKGSVLGKNSSLSNTAM